MIELFTRRYFAFFSHSWVHCPRRTFVPRRFLAVIAVFLYCGIECAFAGDVKSELGSSTFNLGYGLAESRKSLHVPVLSDGIDSLQLSKHSTPENGSGLMKSVFSINCISQMESNPDQRQGSGNSEKPHIPCAECKSKDFHFAVALFCCFVCFWCGWGFKSEFY